MNMRHLLVLVVLAVTFSYSYQTVIGYENSQQELLIYRQQIIVVNEMLRQECPGYITKREILSDQAISVHIDVSKNLYNALVEKLIECRAKKLATTKMPETTTAVTAAPQYADCHDYYENGYNVSGVYQIKLANSTLPVFNVWCDFVGQRGWTVIQRRENESVNFDKPWKDYKEGFGNVSSDYWLGNDRIHILTKSNQKLNIQISTGSNDSSGVWQQIHIADESDNYRLTVNSTGYSGNLVDYLTDYHNGQEFSTSDIDNLSKTCATSTDDEINCSFEVDCPAWSNTQKKDQFDWTLHNGSTPTTNTGPTVDHTIGTKAGRYLYIETSSANNGDNAQYVTTELNPTNGGCLTFWYHMYGHYMSNLKVYLRRTGKPDDLIWQLSGSKGDRWSTGRVGIRSLTSYSIVIEGTKGYGVYGDIAIDDITYTNNALCAAVPADSQKSNKISPNAGADCDANAGLCEREKLQGGWWYNSCGYVNLNTAFSSGMFWGDSVTSSVMRVTRG